MGCVYNDTRAHRKAADCHRCWRICYWTIWTRNWNGGGTAILPLRGRRQHRCAHERAEERVATPAVRLVEDRLRLKVNADKSAVADVEERVLSRFSPNRTKPLRSTG